MPGVLASEIKAMSCPAFSRSTSRGALARSTVVVAGQRGGDAVVREQLAAVARILGGDTVDFLEHAQGAQGDVLEVAERCGDYVQRPRHACDHASPRPALQGTAGEQNFIDGLSRRVLSAAPIPADLEGGLGPGDTQVGRCAAHR
jgi:hypothetical protein